MVWPIDSVRARNSKRSRTSALPQAPARLLDIANRLEQVKDDFVHHVYVGAVTFFPRPRRCGWFVWSTGSSLGGLL
jgi:hypothetical protein